MRARKHRSFLAILLLLGFGIPGSIGILVVQAKAFVGQAEYQRMIQSAGSFTPTGSLQSFTPPFLTPTSFVGTATPPGSSSTTLYAYIQAPSGILARPYVILRAFSTSPRSETITIRGFYNSQEFICTSSACVMYLDASSRFIFRAYSNLGTMSDELIATVTVSLRQNGYVVNVNSVSQFSTFTNSCARTWGLSDANTVTWDDFVQFPYELNTNKTLHTLATELILSGIVDASGCPEGGLSIGLDWPTACGLEKARPKMIEWQNQYDEYIWSASKNYGIPPKIIKTLIEIESQFWPGNSRFYLDEYGLGQLNQLGVDVLLRRDDTLYHRVCPTVLSDCSTPYLSLPPETQAMIRGAVVNLADASCPTCQNGLDLNKASESVSLVTMVLRSNCEQVEYILSQSIDRSLDDDELAATATAAAAPTKKPDEDADAATATAAAATAAAGGSVDTEYEDLWRFTFAAYHGGLSCFQDAVVATRKNNVPVTWENLKEQLKCKSATTYTDGFMELLRAFDFYRYELTDSDIVVPASTFVPTRTPVPTDTPYISSAQVKVQVFMDRNGNQTPDADEWIDAMSVLLTTSSNEQLTQRTQNGIAVFDMSGYPPGLTVNVSLPGLYREQSFELPAQGDVIVVFRFEQPALPTSIP